MAHCVVWYKRTSSRSTDPHSPLFDAT